MSMVSGEEILRNAVEISQSRKISLEDVFSSLKKVLEQTADKVYGAHKHIQVRIDQKNGKVITGRERQVVDHVENGDLEVSINHLPQGSPLKVGDIFFEEIALGSFSRTEAQGMMRAFTKEIRSLELKNQYDEFSGKVGNIFLGVVTRQERRYVILNIQGAEAILPRDKMLPQDKIGIKDYVKVYLEEVISSDKTPQLITSRRHKGFLGGLLAKEVPEIMNGQIEIKAIARDVGSRSKVAVFPRQGHELSSAMADQCVSLCVGIRGSRIRPVSEELKGEKVDIVLWAWDIPTFISNALSPIEVVKVIMDDRSNRVEVVVPDEKQSIAIGRGGQNIRLISNLTGTSIDILTVSQEQGRRQKEMERSMNLFTHYLDLDDMMARFLAIEGFDSLEDIEAASVEDLVSRQGGAMGEEVAAELKERAREAIPLYEEEEKKQLITRGMDPLLVGLSLPAGFLKRLEKHQVLSLEAFAEFSRDEIWDMVYDLNYPQELIDDNIIKARKMLQQGQDSQTP